MDEINHFTFPFGRPLAPIASSGSGHRDVIIIGSQPGALHVQWRIPGGKLAQGIAVDSEPQPYWDGHDQIARIADWKQAVGWREQWGDVGPTRRNGGAGQWLDQQVLAPLRLTRDRVQASALADRFQASETVLHRIDEHYTPRRGSLDLPVCALPGQMPTEALVRAALGAQRERLLGLLHTPGAQVLITLGHPAARVVKDLLGPAVAQVPADILADGPVYGQAHPVVLTGRSLRWYAFVDPAVAGRQRSLHRSWVARLIDAPQARVGCFK